MTVELWIPGRAPNLNDLIRERGRGKGFAYRDLKESWERTVALAVMKSRWCLMLPRVSVHFEIVEPNTRRDPDNIAAGTAKLVLDGLVKAGVLAGDSWAHIAGLSFSWRVGPTPGVRVVLTEVEAVGVGTAQQVRTARASRKGAA